jgi:hypothetical protein
VTLGRTSILTVHLLLAACSPIDHDGSAESEGAPRQYSGVWLYRFEGSTFLEGAKSVPNEHPSLERSAWLQYHPDQRYPGERIELSKYDAYDEAKACYPLSPFFVTFIGWKIDNPGGSGHFGLWDSEFKVERMISSEPLGAPFCYDG